MNWFLFLFLLPLMTLPVFAFDINDIVTEHTKNQWYTGKGIAPGDSFTYRICDYHDRHLFFDGPQNSCYQIRMDFYIQLESYTRDNIWVVQAEIILVDDNNNHNDPFFHIFLIDPDTMQIKTYSSNNNKLKSSYVESIEQTIFYLHKFASEQQPKHLHIGGNWGKILSRTNFGTDLIITSKDQITTSATTIQNSTTMNVFVLEYGLFESSTFTISPDIAFPLTGTIHDPHWILPDPPLLFTFELIQYDSAASANHNDTLEQQDITTNTTHTIESNPTDTSNENVYDDSSFTNQTITITKVQ